MNAVDTNVLARLILSDDQAQALIARGLLDAPVWIATTVWLELGWVLEKQLKLGRTMVADALASLLAIDTVHTDHATGLDWAIGRYRDGADWADMIHLISVKQTAATFATFDRALARHAGPDAPVQVDTLI